ncbi:hypothetical protein GUJ93_ZPchr0013g33937 [Zizania palustris]|uniref:Uncharacterized protein n=1 Tax=Zizania palustris TaxID=103762 RepID=A0A8J5WW93_ZIZPA|nr:hypothetical protein GUJ93_ZPchr0013g33937 [Zizania palustris]
MESNGHATLPAAQNSRSQPVPSPSRILQQNVRKRRMDLALASATERRWRSAARRPPRRIPSLTPEGERGFAEVAGGGATRSTRG